LHWSSVGASGVIFGMLGAQAVLNWRFGAQLPGGYRIPMRNWLMLFFINFLALPAAIPQIDTAAHVGGLLAGAATAWLLWRDPQLINEPLPASSIDRLGASRFALLWGAGIATGLSRMNEPEALASDHRVLSAALLRVAENRPNTANELAWTTAISPQATRAELDAAYTMFKPVVDAELANTNRTERHAPFADTLATIEYRRGNLARALDLEEPLLQGPEPVYSSQYARFLRAWVKRNGVRQVGDVSNNVPTVRLDSNGSRFDRLTLTNYFSPPSGALLDVLIENNEQLVGLLRLRFGTGAAPTIVNLTGDVPESAVPLRAVLAQVRDDCGCAAGSVAAEYRRFNASVATFP
jgi:hypothetical protein